MTRDAGPDCLRVTIPLRDMAAGLHDEAELSIVGGDALFGSFDPWLYRPEPWPTGMRARLEVEAPPSVAVSLPFARTDDGAYVVPRTAWSLMARVAIGKVSIDTVDVPGAKVTVAGLPGAAQSVTTPGVRRFVEGAAKAVASLDGKMPAANVQLLLLPSRGQRRADPIRFGMAMHGGGPGVMLFVNGAAKDEQLYGEWVTVHELSHLWLPALEPRDSPWLPEGFATYYQCILRSRAGMYSEEVGWDELLSGFDRGRAQASANGNTPLAEVGRPHFQHYYWGGAAIMLKLDVLLRKAGSSLDAVIATTRRALPFDDDGVDAKGLIARFSQIAGRDLGAEIATWTKASFPDTAAELRELGVSRRGDSVALDERAPLSATRKAIAARR